MPQINVAFWFKHDSLRQRRSQVRTPQKSSIQRKKVVGILDHPGRPVFRELWVWALKYIGLPACLYLYLTQTYVALVWNLSMTCEPNIYVSWSTSEIKVRLVPSNMFKHSSCFLTDGGSFVDQFCYLCFVFVFVILSCLFFEALWSPAGKGRTSWLSVVWYFCVLCHFPIWCPVTGVVHYCTDS